MLIERLNALSHLSPDEMASKLRNRWMKPSELGREYFEANKHKYQYWYQAVYPDGSLGIAANRVWRFDDCAGRYDRFVAALETSTVIYWIIHIDHYVKGELPPCNSTS